MARVLAAFGAGAAALGLGTYACCFTVRPGEAAVVFNRVNGIKDAVYTEGLQFRMPGLEDPKYYSIRLRPRELSTTTGTKDLQKVNIRLRVLFRPIAEKLPEIYRKYGLDYDERILPSVSNEALKAVVAEYQAEELIRNRDAVSERLQQLMRERVREFNLVLEDIALVDVQFTSEFMQAVESKQVAQQEAERFKFVVLENEQRKKAAIVRAEGESEAARLISEAMSNAGPGFVELRKIEAARDIVATLSKAPNVNFVPGSNALMMAGMVGGMRPRTDLPVA
jgi:prohibitin 1